jgi:hypothetical protein
LWRPTTGALWRCRRSHPIWTIRVKLGFNSGYAVMFFYVISGFLIT